MRHHFLLRLPKMHRSSIGVEDISTDTKYGVPKPKLSIFENVDTNRPTLMSAHKLFLIVLTK